MWLRRPHLHGVLGGLKRRDEQEDREWGASPAAAGYRTAVTRAAGASVPESETTFGAVITAQ